MKKLKKSEKYAICVELEDILTPLCSTDYL